MVKLERSLLVALLGGILSAETLPVRVYTPADGLPGIAVHRIVRDSQGFLWFCTGEGLARFDGYRFVSYGTADGLPEQNVHDLAENGDGTYWIATAAGLVHFDPSAVKSRRPRFVVHRPPGGPEANWVVALARAPNGTILVGTRDGLFQLRIPTAAESVPVVQLERMSIPLSDDAKGREIRSLTADQKGRLWIGTGSGLFRGRLNRRGAAGESWVCATTGLQR
jgi:ligand-binding sensor domain-containing protein